MAKRRRKSRSTKTRSTRRPVRNTSYSGRSRRRTSRSTRSRATSRTQTVRIVLEPAAANPALPVPSALPTIPGTQVVMGKKSRF